MPRTSGGAFTFMITGNAVVGTGQAGALVPDAFTISHVKVYSDMLPTVSNLVVDIMKNGTTIFSTTANRPTVIPAGPKLVNSGIPDVTALAAGDILRVDVITVGTVTGGNPLFVTVVLV